MKEYNWAVNKAKLVRAINIIGEDDEDKLIKQYVILGGLVDKDKVKKTVKSTKNAK